MRTDRHANRHGKADSCFSKFCEVFKKEDVKKQKRNALTILSIVIVK